MPISWAMSKIYNYLHTRQLAGHTVATMGSSKGIFFLFFLISSLLLPSGSDSGTLHIWKLDGEALNIETRHWCPAAGAAEQTQHFKALFWAFTPKNPAKRSPVSLVESLNRRGVHIQRSAGYAATK